MYKAELRSECSVVPSTFTLPRGALKKRKDGKVGRGKFVIYYETVGLRKHLLRKREIYITNKEVTRPDGLLV